MRAVVGLDVGRDQVDICFLVADGSEPVARWRVPNTQPGAEALAARLADLAQQHRVAALHIGLEATGLYWWPLACALKDAPALGPYQAQVYALNPQLVHTFRANYGALPKTDKADAFVIAERVRWGRHLPAPFQVDLRYAPLQRLTRFRYHLVHTLVREKNYFLTFLFLQFSGFCQVRPFQDPFGTTSCAVLEEFTTEELAQAALEELADFVATQGRGQFHDPQAVATTLQRAARDSFRLDKVLAEPLRVVLGTTMATIRTLQRQLKAVDRTIAQELQALPQTLDSVPGLGPVWTAGLVAEIGDITRFATQASLAQYAGLTWKIRQSGQFQAEDTALTKRGNTYLRYYLVEAANSVRVHCADYRAYYQAKYAQSTKHHHKRALVLTARKLVRLVDALLRTDRRYRPSESGQDQKEGALPSRQRPGRHRHPRRAVAVG
ncbi:MAG: IS110 family transposase [Dehalococcoidia bacterium]|nr:IS110 family transposase [Dehalococcoidia bacterium]